MRMNITEHYFPDHVFTHNERLNRLRSRGWAVYGLDAPQIGLAAILYTIMIRDEHNCYVPCAHFLAEFEGSGIALECLKKIKLW
jgi:hypothetical protein